MRTRTTLSTGTTQTLPSPILPVDALAQTVRTTSSTSSSTTISIRTWLNRGDLPLYRELGPENGKGYQEIVQALDGVKSSVVRVNDRGPYVHSRIIDLSAAAARELGMKQDGLARVRIEAFAADQGAGGPAVAVAPDSDQ